MMQAELDSIPEVGGITFREETVDGKQVRIPVFTGKALWQKDDDPCVIDSAGQRWMVGRQDGRRVKQKMLGRSP